MTTFEKNRFRRTRDPHRPPPQTSQSPEDDDEAEDLPPAYSASQNPPITPVVPIEQQTTSIRMVPGVPTINYSAYSPLDGKPSTDLGTINIVDATLCKSPQAFAKFLAEQISIPPMPEINIKGIHRGWSGDEVDFDIRLNMMRYFLPEPGTTGLRYSKLISAGKSKSRVVEPSTESAGIEQWTSQFCKSSSPDKIFVISRRLTNWDQEYITGRLHGLVQSLNYKGHTEITIPVSYHTVVVKPSSSFASTLRSAFYGPERYELEVCWPYANHLPGEESDGEQRLERKCLVRSEMGWFKDWSGTIKAAVLGRKRGWVGEADWIEHAMRGRAIEHPQFSWGESRR